MDLQPVIDVYAIAKYIASYITKANKGMSELMRNAVKQAVSKPEEPAIVQLKSLSNEFVRATELSAQEASVLVLRLPLFYSTRSVIFVNTNHISQRGFMIKPFDLIEQLPDDSTDVSLMNFQKRYTLRPKNLADICLADWCSQFVDFRGNVKLEENSGLVGGDSEEDGVIEFATTPYKLTNGQYVRRIKSSAHYKILRYVRFNISISREDYFRELLMLFYPFSDPEENDILNNYKTYETRYSDVLESVEKKRKIYEHWRGDLEAAREELNTVDGELAIANMESLLAPNIRHIDDTDILRGDTQITVLEDDPELNRDIIVPGLKTDDDFRIDFCKLNEKQEQFFLEVISFAKNSLFGKLTNIYPLVSGGAGTGKSVLLSCLFQGLTRVFRNAQTNPSKPTVVLAAYTALAAKNIGGNTLHSLLGMTFGSTADNANNTISPDILNTYRCHLSDLRVLLVDEVSFVGCNFLNAIDQRLRQIMCIDEPFGGVTVIFFGDLFQLAPVRDPYIFEKPSGNFSPLIQSVWKLYRMFELTQIMRQEELSWCELLARFREGNHTDVDLRRLQLLVNRKLPPSAPRACYLNARVNEFNAIKMSECLSTKHTSVAEDTLTGNPHTLQCLMFHNYLLFSHTCNNYI